MMNISTENSLMAKRMASSSDATKENQKHWTIGIGQFFTLGIGAMILGLPLAAESYLGLVIESDRIANVSVSLLIISFILISLGAHCMDKVAAIEREVNSTMNK